MSTIGIRRNPTVEAPGSSVGDFTYNPKTGAVSKMKGGGHGQANPNALPRAPTPLGTERVLHLRCVTRLTFVCMLRYPEWDAVPIWVPGFFGIYSGMLY